MDSRTLLTGSSDSSAKLWEVETGKNTFTFKYQAPCRAVAFSLGESHAALSTDPFMATLPAINIVRIAEDPAEQAAEPVQVLTGFSKRINRVAFHDHNAVLITAGEDGFLRRWDIEVCVRPFPVSYCDPSRCSGCICKISSNLQVVWHAILAPCLPACTSLRSQWMQSSAC